MGHGIGPARFQEKRLLVNCLREGFDPTASNTFTNSSESLTLYYGGGSKPYGFFGYDTVRYFDESQAPPVAKPGYECSLSVTKQEFLLAQSGPMEPIIGLNQYNYGSESQQPPLSRWMQQSVLGKQRIFSIYIARAPNPSQPNSRFRSEISFGAINPNFYTGQMQWLPLLNRQWNYEVAFGGLIMNGQPVRASDHQKSIITDTGSGAIFAPRAAVDHLYAIAGTTFGARLYKCSTFNSTQRFTIRLGGIDIPFTGDRLMQAGLPDTDQCYPPFWPSSSWSLGLPFLRVFYTAYDLANEKFGLAPAI